MKKKMFFAFTAAVILASCPMTAFAGEWKQNANGVWYQNDDGTNPAGRWEVIGNNRYYFKSDGYMNTGWIQVDGQWYYCEPTGEMRVSELQTDVFTFKFNPDGSCYNFYENVTPSAQAGWASYGTTSLSTWADAIAAGNIVYYNGSYWAKPGYTSALKDEEIVYFHDISQDEDYESQILDKYTLGIGTVEFVEYESDADEQRDLDGIS